MKKLLVISFLLVFMLVGCAPTEYTKGTGEVIGKHISVGRYGTSYYVTVSYPTNNGKFSITDVDISKGDYDVINMKDNLTIYVDSLGSIATATR